MSTQPLRPDVGPPVRVTGLVARGELPITVTERGELESSSTVDARCEVEGEQMKLVSILPRSIMSNFMARGLRAVILLRQRPLVW